MFVHIEWFICKARIVLAITSFIIDHLQHKLTRKNVKVFYLKVLFNARKFRMRTVQLGNNCLIRISFNFLLDKSWAKNSIKQFQNDPISILFLDWIQNFLLDFNKNKLFFCTVGDEKKAEEEEEMVCKSRWSWKYDFYAKGSDSIKCNGIFGG